MIMKARSTKQGYTLIELIVAVGLFSIIMTLSTGAYLVMIGVNRHTQGLATGINNLSFALESMTTNIRTGSAYCSASDCIAGVNSSSFSFRDRNGAYVRYGLVNGTIMVCKSQTGFCNPLTAGTAVTTPPPAVSVTRLTFNATGIATTDVLQPYVRMNISGTVTTAPGKTQTFDVQTGAIMRGTDL